jgi:hypothetical protein
MTAFATVTDQRDDAKPRHRYFVQSGRCGTVLAHSFHATHEAAWREACAMHGAYREVDASERRAA